MIYAKHLEQYLISECSTNPSSHKFINFYVRSLLVKGIRMRNYKGRWGREEGGGVKRRRRRKGRKEGRTKAEKPTDGWAGWRWEAEHIPGLQR